MHKKQPNRTELGFIAIRPDILKHFVTIKGNYDETNLHNREWEENPCNNQTEKGCIMELFTGVFYALLFELIGGVVVCGIYFLVHL